MKRIIITVFTILCLSWIPMQGYFAKKPKPIILKPEKAKPITIKQKNKQKKIKQKKKSISKEPQQPPCLKYF